MNLNSRQIFSEKWFVPVCTFLVYNIGDTIGRILTNFCQVPSRDSPFKIYLFSALRLVFIVLFPLCNVQRMPSATLPTLINSGTGSPTALESSKTRLNLLRDIGYAILVLLLAISNGYLTTLSFIYAPSRLMEHSEKAKAEEYVFIALTFGLISGSAVSFGTKAATLYL